MTRALTFLLLSLSASRLFGLNVVPIDRLLLPGNDWQGAGVPGGIPDSSTMTIYTTVPATNITTTALNALTLACPSNQVIQFSAYTYVFDGNPLNLAKDGVIWRGITNANGQATTFFTTTKISLAKCPWPSADWNTLTPQTVSGGLSNGSTTLYLSASVNSEVVVGDNFIVDQTDDGTLVTASSVTWAHRPNRAWCQVLQCTNKSGSTIGFTPPLIGSYWSLAQTPQAFGWAVIQSGGTLKRAAMENIDVSVNLQTYAISFGPAYACWLKNVNVTGWATSGGAAGVRLTYSANCSIVDGMAHDQGVVVSSSYGYYPVVVTACAIENNIFTNLALALPCISAVGCSFSYNYCVGPYPYSPSTWFAEYYFPHGGHTHDTLYEGNWMEGPLYYDQVFGGNNSRNLHRGNRIIGQASGKTGDTRPITLELNMDDLTFINNVLGQNGYHTIYSSSSGSDVAIYGIDASCSGIIKTNNYNVVDGGVNILETLIGTLVSDSYRFASKPAFAGNRQWPFVKVEWQATNTWYYTNLAAGYRAKFGTWPPASGSAGPSIAVAQTVKAGTVILQ